jgi:mono/diheme cytochrome c family protein
MKLKIITGIGFLLLALIVACQSDEEQEFKRYYSGGTLIYQTYCQNCHGASGEGLNGLIPPLTDSLYLKTNKAALACAIKYGIKGKISIANKLYEGEMPANNLAPIEIAKVLTYIANSFGNKMSIISSEKVEAELRSCK